MFGVGQAIDTWLLTQELDAKSLRKYGPILIGMFRRTLSPEEP